ncbi:MAG TPA: ATP-binding protein, partial [Polyangia bacterium]|nr:ATP-binding protein [Polyangia bacterium]
KTSASSSSASSADLGDQREFLNIIVEEVNRLNKIVSQFLDYARPYRGEQKPLEVADVLKKTLQLMAKEDASHFEITTAFAERLPPVRADAEQLLQVFLNLSLNALQAMPQGGKLLISTGLRRATRRGAAAAFLEIRFRDTGVGIPPGDLKNLFIPFFTTKDKGTGLGLPISQRIIENHGGTIEVRSQPAEGATFTVLLPVEADAYAAYAELSRFDSGRRTPTGGPIPALPGPRLPPPGPGVAAIPAPISGVVTSPVAAAASAKTPGVTPPLLPAAPARKG